MSTIREIKRRKGISITLCKHQWRDSIVRYTPGLSTEAQVELICDLCKKTRDIVRPLPASERM